jgi:hypothetical protein
MNFSHFHAGFCPAYFSALKMEAICFSETSVHIQRTTRRYIPDDSTLHSHRCENLKSHFCTFFPQKSHHSSLLLPGAHRAGVVTFLICGLLALGVTCDRITDILLTYDSAVHHTENPNRLAQAVTFLACIQEVLGSYLGRGTCYSD